ncbi:MAG: nuclear transport factor 2 family protein [Aliidiomarina sp.]|uniref:YybH family protein n=1 Tax=Aliidiomarina sp. TaxID=1872439 RepID=UPI0025C112AB|nr:nuclear transport factor 2 family protein [Aliidiomarina sp.]MCH8500927.1 nuclear transport factor 2 family protein [Aliidiomarina sp.]
MTLLGVIFIAALILSPSVQADSALEQKFESLQQAMLDKDHQRLSELFAYDGMLHIANMPPVEGRPAIGGFFSRLFFFLESTRYTHEYTSIATGNDVAWMTGRVVNTFAGDRELTSYEGKFLMIWENGDDGWQIALYSVSNNAPN